MEAPERAPGGHVVDRKADLRPVDEDDPERREQEQGRQLERGQRRDRAGAEPDAECIEREQRAVYGGEQQRARQRRRQRGHEIGDLDRECRGDSRARGDVGDPHQRAADESGEGAVGRREVAVGPAGDLHAAADGGEAERDRDDCERARDQRQRRGSTHLRGERGRHAEDATADDGIDDRRRQRERPDRPKQRGLALQRRGRPVRILPGHADACAALDLLARRPRPAAVLADQAFLRDAGDERCRPARRWRRG